MTGYWERYSYVGRMPDGKWRRFVSEDEYVEAYREDISLENHAPV